MWLQRIRALLKGRRDSGFEIPGVLTPFLNYLKKEGFSLPKPELVVQSMTHQSFVNEGRHSYRKDYQRLEFLGDAVLELITRKYLYLECPMEQEGELSMRKSILVRRGSLGRLAEKIDLPNHIRLGQGEISSGGRQKPSILADIFEALLGALFLNDGLPPVEDWFLRTFDSELAKVTTRMRTKSYKNQIQELVQSRFNVLPRYRVLQESGPEHRKIFSVGIFVGKKMYAHGEGRSKKAAQEMAARRAIEKIQPAKAGSESP